MLAASADDVGPLGAAVAERCRSRQPRRERLLDRGDRVGVGDAIGGQPVLALLKRAQDTEMRTASALHNHEATRQYEQLKGIKGLVEGAEVGGLMAQAVSPGYGSKWGRGFAIVVRFTVLMSIAYIVSQKLIPNDLMAKPLIQLSFADLLGIIFKLGLALAIGGYFFLKAFNTPEVHARNQQWCEAWQSVGFLVPLYFVVMTLCVFNPPEKEPWKEIFQWLLHGTTWLLFN
jgi:hypothetical protein